MNAYKKFIVILSLILSSIYQSGFTQECRTGGCSNFVNQFPTTTLTPTTAWNTASSFMNGGNYTLFNVTCGNTYDWTYCENYGGVSTAWDAQLTLYNNSGLSLLCFSDDNCGTNNRAPFIRWTAGFTGTVRLLTSKYSCLSNGTGAPWNKLMYRIFNAPTSSVTVIVRNVSGALVNNARVKLYNSDYSQVLQTVYTNSSGQAPFNPLGNGSYNYEVYYLPSGLNSPVINEEFWGSGSFQICSGGQSMPVNFTRNQPYFSSPPSFSPPSLQIGQTTNGNFSVINPLPYSTNSYVAVWVDPNQSSPWDYNNNSSTQSINSGGTLGFGINNIPPSNTGTYYSYAFVYSFVNNNYIITDQYPWTNAFTTNCPFLSQPTSPNPGVGSAPGTEISTLTPTFSWSGNPSGIYHVQIWDAATNPTTPNNVIYGFETPTSSPGHCVFGLSHTIPPGVLANNGQYKWSVHRNDPCGECESSPTPELYFNINTNPCTQPTSQSSNINFTGNDGVSVTANWQTGSGTARIVKVNTVNNFSNPVNGIAPTNVNNNYLGSGEQIVYYGSGTSVYVNQLQPNQTYYFRVYEANCSGIQILYNVNTGTVNPNSVTMNGVVQPPIANFISSALTVVTGQSINYFDLSSNATSVLWKIEREQSNGTLQVYTTTSAFNHTVTFYTPGCYKVTLTATNSQGSNSLSRTCYTYVLPNSTTVVPEAVTRAQKYYQYFGGDPVAAATGDYTYSTSDLAMYGIGTTFSIKRYYHSRNSNIGLFGKGWTSNIESYVDLSDDGTWVVHHDDGHESYWSPFPGGQARSYFPEWGDSISYTYNSGTGLITVRYQTQEGMVYLFSGLFGSRANLQSISDLYNNSINFIYSGNNFQFIDLPGGRRYSVSVNGFGRATTIIDQGGRALNSYYSADGTYLDSTSVAGSTTRFSYTIGKLYAIVNPAGDTVVRNYYNGALQVIKQDDAYGRSIVFDYNTPAVGQTTITYPTGKKRIIINDANSRAVNIKNELGAETKVQYNSQGLPDSTTNERGYGTKKYYDVHQNPIKTINAKGFSDSLSWSMQNRPTYIADYEGNKLNMTYNAQGSPIGVYMPHGVQKEILYDSKGLDTLSVDGNGYQIRKEYNNFGDLIKLSDFRGIWFYSYDEIGRLTVVTHPNNGKDSIFYNHFNQITKIKDPLGYSAQWMYNDNGVLISYIDKSGVTTNYELNHIDNVIAIHQSENRHTYLIRDSLELPIKTVYGDGTKRTVLYDDVQRPVQIKDSINGVIRSTEYFEDGTTKSSTAYTGGKWQIQRDEIGDISQVTAPNGNKQSYVRNKNSVTTDYTDTKQSTTNYLLDSLGRITKTTDPLALNIESYFAKRSIPDSIKDANGVITKNTFDLAGRIVSHFDGAETWLYEWDAENNLTKATLPDGTIIERIYSLRNELTEIKVNGVSQQRFYHNANSLPDSMLYIGGKYTYERNTLSEVTKQTDHLANEIKYSRDAIGRIDTLTYPGGKMATYLWPNRNQCIVTDWRGKQYQLFYNNEGKRTGIFYPNGNQTLGAINTSLEYVEHKNWGKINNLPAGYYQSNLLRYDSGYIAKDSGTSVMPLIVIPPSAGGTYEKGDKQKTWDGYTYSLDKQGNRIGEIKSQAPIETNYFTHDWRNQCISYRYKGDSVQNTFDALGGRIKKVNLTKGTTQLFVMDYQIAGWPVLLQARTAANTEHYSILYAPDGMPLMIDSAGMIRYYHFDYLGNIVSLSDTTGNITDKYRSDVYGKYAAHIGTSSQPLTWQGEFNCQMEGNELYLLGGGVRLYDAKSHRFLEQDPLGGSTLTTQTSNLYTFGLNNPTEWNDPTGMQVAENNTSYDNNHWVRDGLIDGLQKIANGNWLGTGYAQNAYNYYEQAYINSVINGKPNNWFLVGLGASSLWTPQNYQTTLGAFTLETNYSGQSVTKIIGKTGYFKILDMRTTLGRDIKIISGIRDAFNVVKETYNGIYKKRENFRW